MRIGGWQKFSLIDYPGKASAVIFTTGCNFRCHYCHNPELVLPRQYAPPISLPAIYSFLAKRKGKLDGVCVSGGEPTFHKDLPIMIERIKKMGFLVKLDTNGTNPAMLAYLLEKKRIDYVAMDIKAPLTGYAKVVGWQVAPGLIERSIDLLKRGGIPYEFRTTIVKGLTRREDLHAMAEMIKGAPHYYLQQFVATKLNNPAWQGATSYNRITLERIAEELQVYVQHCTVR